MKAIDLLSESTYTPLFGDLSVEVDRIYLNSRSVKPGSAFLCISGSKADGHKYIENAVDQGARLIITEDGQKVASEELLKKLSEEKGVCVVSVPDSRAAYADLSGTYFGHPAKDLEMIGITGTKGKTTSTYLIHTIFEAEGRHCGLIGSVENKIGPDEACWSEHTTPEAWEFQELLAQMKNKDVHSCVMEVSSLGLKYHRTQGVKFKVGVFTNFFLDHIMTGEHEDEEEYFRCKMQLFEDCEMALINKNTRRLEEVLEHAKVCGKVYTYSISQDADFMAKDIESVEVDGVPGMQFTFVTPTYRTKLYVPLLCEFNVDNALCAASTSYLCGISEEGIQTGVGKVYVPGRMEKIRNELGLHVYVDYAHNGDSLRVLLSSLRPFCKGKIITVFGCGGDRSQYRRSGMGEMSARYSDYSIVTTDNSRSESFESIFVLIKEGIEKVENARYEVIQDRHQAIAKALEMAAPDDFVVIAGKGHERTMDINHQIFEFVDADEAHKAIRALAKARKAER
ncbi:MAG: UDP-N-acetylmuramoyl-L-alanyl-D-glutamate--2,6-diaminopimelate ligase [Clostridiales bacterium]|nr:UDP-N-acetylmuramoyl-L-alanyl-D-glutamate--2,6-diaminopimelate ligase [Clostridiales bacterium]